MLVEIYHPNKITMIVLLLLVLLILPSNISIFCRSCIFGDRGRGELGIAGEPVQKISFC